MIGKDSLDYKILNLLGKNPSYPSEISRKLSVLRTTVQYRLERLGKANLIKKTTSGKKSVWRSIYKNTHNKNYYRAYNGKDVIQAYEQILTLPRHTILFAIQGSNAARDEFKILPPLFIKEAHKVFKKKNILMKGISNNKSLEIFNTLDEDMVTSHIGRAQGLKIFSDDTFTVSGEIMSTEKLLLLINPKSKLAIVIKDTGVTKIVNDALRLLFGFLDKHKTFDLNYYLKNKVAP